MWNYWHEYVKINYVFYVLKMFKQAKIVNEKEQEIDGERVENLLCSFSHAYLIEIVPSIYQYKKNTTKLDN